MTWERAFRLFFLVCILGVSGLVMAEQDQIPAKIRQSMTRMQKFGLKSDSRAIVIDASAQRLYLIRSNHVLETFPVSTAEKGLGNRNGSYQTPTGVHRICKKIGDGATIGTIFKARKDTGRIATIYTDNTDSADDFVTTRILRLEGLEPGVNKGGNVDSFLRLIYIHGTPEEGLIGRPASHGCIRMKNHDVVKLFNEVPVGTLVDILR